MGEAGSWGAAIIDTISGDVPAGRLYADNSMPYSRRPIWQILTAAAELGSEVTLTCDECFAIMEQLADEAIKGLDSEMIHHAIRRSIAHCPDCTEHHQQRLAELEAKIVLHKRE